MVIILKYVENIRWRENFKKMEFKFRFRVVKLRGSPLFTDTMSESWLSY